MFNRLAAEVVVLVHIGFVLFVVLGGLLVWRWPRVAWLHIPAASWGALLEFMGWMCPLTPLENYFRRRAGDAGYEGAFVEHYIVPLIYPSALTPNLQIVLGVFVVVLNFAVYLGYFILRKRKRLPA